MQPHQDERYVRTIRGILNRLNTLYGVYAAMEYVRLFAPQATPDESILSMALLYDVVTSADEQTIAGPGASRSAYLRTVNGLPNTVTLQSIVNSWDDLAVQCDGRYPEVVDYIDMFPEDIPVSEAVASAYMYHQLLDAIRSDSVYRIGDIVISEYEVKVNLGIEGDNAVLEVDKMFQNSGYVLL